MGQLEAQTIQAPVALETEVSSASASMRLLLLTYEFPPLGGGAGNSAYELVQSLGDMPGVEVVVVTSSMGDYQVKKNTLTPNSTIYYLPIGKTKGNIHFQTNGELLKYSWACHRFLKKLLKTERFDHCHAHMTVPAGVNAYLFRKKIPYTVSLQGSDVPGYSVRFKRMYTFLTPIIHRVWKSASHVISNSVGLRDLALVSAPTQDVGVITNGVDRELFSHDGKVAKLGGAPDSRRIICVGRLIDRKGVWELVEAFKNIAEKLPDTHLDLVGTGVLLDPLQQWVNEQGLQERITLHGAVDHDILPEYLRRSSLFVLPSHAEGMSNALLEGMSCGLPVIVTETGGTKELLDGNGVAVPKQDPEALGQAIYDILSDDSTHEQMCRASLRISEQYSWDGMAEQYMQLYSQAKAK